MSCEYRISEQKIIWTDDRDKVKKMGGVYGVAVSDEEPRSLCQILTDELDPFPACPDAKKSSAECEVAQKAK